jgi:hypothetical protein
VPKLTPEEQSFLDNECEEACRLVDDWKVTHELYDLPHEAWRYIKDKGFLGMIIPKKYGGLEFSAYAHSQVVTKLSTRSSALSVSVMVPNSLGPAELLLHYGTEAQKNHYLPRLAKGIEVPAFALTSPWAGSDAASIPDTGVSARACTRARKCSACASAGTSATSRWPRCARCSAWPSTCSTRTACSATRSTSASPARWCPTTIRASIPAVATSRSTPCS